MSRAFKSLYNAKLFDPTDRQDILAEVARKALLDVAIKRGLANGVESGQDMPYLLGGLIVGIVQILQATAGPSDETDAAIRASIIEIAPWAVDMARASEGKDPLANA